MTTEAKADLTSALRDTATLVTLTIHKWSATKTDKSALEELKKATGAKGDAGKVIKNLLANADQEYKAACSIFDAARNSHYRLTVPWHGGTGGPQSRLRGPGLLPNVLFDDYIRTMAEHKNKGMAAVEELIQHFPDSIAIAQTSLGAMANRYDYPPAEILRRSFGISFDFQPVPSGADFKGLPPATLERLSIAVENRVTRQLDNAMDEALSRVRETLGHLKERLGDPKNKLYASSLDKIKVAGSILEAFQPFDDRITVIRGEIGQLVNGLHINELRSDNMVRQSVAQGAEDILRRMETAGL